MGWRARWTLALLALAVAGCAGVAAVRDGADTAGSVVGRTFWSTAVTGYTLLEGTRVELTFRDDGRLSAAAGCNSLGGSYRLDGDRLVIDAPRTTEMGCDTARHAQDEWLYALLGGEMAWTLDGDLLTLAGDQVTIDLADEESLEVDVALVGTRWELAGFSDAGGPDAMAMSSSAPGYLVLAEDGAVEGHDGCVPFTATYTVDADVVHFAGARFGTGECTLLGSDDPNRVRAVIAAESTPYRADGSSLTLLDPEGRSVNYSAP